MSDPLKIEYVSGVEGPSLYLISAERGGYRIAGPKPWGGGKCMRTWTVPDIALEEIRKAINARLRVLRRTKP